MLDKLHILLYENKNSTCIFRFGFLLPARKNCQDYKNGKFKFNYSIDSISKTGIFTRQDNLSIEYYDGKTDSSSVRWINDCEYVVKKINPKNRAEEKSVHIKILTTTDNSYTFEFGIVGNNKAKSKGTAFKTN